MEKQIVILGDIKLRPSYYSDTEAKRAFKHAFSLVGKKYAEDFSEKFHMTGDGWKFEGSLRTEDHLFSIIDTIRDRLNPIKLYMGVGLHEEIPGTEKSTLDPDGPAYRAAKNAMEYLRQDNPNDEREVYLQMPEGGPSPLPLDGMNVMLHLVCITELSWTEIQRATFRELAAGSIQKECAKAFRVSQSTISRWVTSKNYRVYEIMREELQSFAKDVWTWEKEHESQSADKM